MSTSFESFLPEVMPNVAACPEMVALNAIRNACREFCTRTTIWREDLTPVTSVAGTATYSLTFTSGVTIVIPTYVSFNSNEIFPTSVEELNQRASNWRNASNGTPSNYLVETPGTIRLYVPPDSAVVNGIFVRAALKPTLAATAIGDVVYNEWVETIAAGALANLFKMPGKDWSSPQLGIYYGGIFESGIANARATVDTGNVRKSRQVQMQFW